MRHFIPSFRLPVSNPRWVLLALFLVLPFAARTAQAQSLGYEGPTGVFVTPLASTAASPAHGAGHPVIAYHVLAGGPVIGTRTPSPSPRDSPSASRSATRAKTTLQATPPD